MGRIIVVVVDGMGDRPIDGKTPLQYANTPNIDLLCREGITGQMNTITPGIVPGSDTGHLAIFGYDPYKTYPGRGVFEALGAGIKLEEGDVAFRCNLATVDEKLNVVDRRAGRIKDGKKIVEEIDGMEINGVEIILKSTTEHRCSLVLRGENLSNKISDVDPHSETKIWKSKALENTHEARRTADIINKLVEESYKILKDHPINKEREKEGKLPANILLPRGAGKYVEIESIKEKWGFKASCIAGGALYKGVARYLGASIIDVRGATGRLDTNLHAKVDAALKSAEQYEYTFLHIKGCDNASHDGDFRAKAEMISRIDEEVVSKLIDFDGYVLITADHSTPVFVKRHTSDPVPILFHGEDVRRDSVELFDEISVVHGGLGTLRGIDLMPIVSDYIGYYKMYGS
ncbi:MAG: 2,3-bisphosphoglycerate-independent phosphoglycerate mutase [Candidatus Hydrothermarchaeota archaeon]